MADEELEVIDAEVEEIPNLPAVRSSGMLLAGADTQAKLEHAMEIAKALSHVIDQQGLYASIGGKKHVLVEGWELLGSLLGVFPVVEWSRPVENGWEARVVAKTLEGAEVGSAEMMCTRDENRWKSADDYAIRSMAQTRAVSKSLRAPLGFVMKLAGYDPTPEAEALVTTPAPPKPFDPEKDLIPGALSGPEARALLWAALDSFDPTVDWSKVTADVSSFLYDSTVQLLEPEQYADFLRRLSNAVKTIQDNTPAGDFPPVSADDIVKGFAYAFGGVKLTLEYVEVPTPEAVLSEEQVKVIDESLAKDDVPFGYEKD